MPPGKCNKETQAVLKISNQSLTLKVPLDNVLLCAFVCAPAVSESCYLGREGALYFVAGEVLTLALLGTLGQCLDFSVLSVHSGS